MSDVILLGDMCDGLAPVALERMGHRILVVPDVHFGSNLPSQDELARIVRQAHTLTGGTYVRFRRPCRCVRKLLMVLQAGSLPT